jgi:hypothetical protein
MSSPCGLVQHPQSASQAFGSDLCCTHCGGVKTGVGLCLRCVRAFVRCLVFCSVTAIAAFLRVLIKLFVMTPLCHMKMMYLETAHSCDACWNSCLISTVYSIFWAGDFQPEMCHPSYAMFNPKHRNLDSGRWACCIFQLSVGTEAEGPSIA